MRLRALYENAKSFLAVFVFLSRYYRTPPSLRCDAFIIWTTYSLYIGIVKQSADFIGHAQIEIQVKKFFKGQLEESFKIQSCQKPNENDFLNFF